MAVIVPIEKLRKGLGVIASRDVPVTVQLRDTHTVYRDRDTGWTIRGDEKKDLPMGPTGTPSQSLMMAIRAGRFVKVETEKGKKSKAQDLVEFISGQTPVDEALTPKEEELPKPKTSSKSKAAKGKGKGKAKAKVEEATEPDTETPS